MQSRSNTYVRSQVARVNLHYPEPILITPEWETAFLDYEDGMVLLAIEWFTNAEHESGTIYLFRIVDPETPEDQYQLIRADSEAEAHDACKDKLSSESYISDVRPVEYEIPSHYSSEDIV